MKITQLTGKITSKKLHVAISFVYTCHANHKIYGGKSTALHVPVAYALRRPRDGPRPGVDREAERVALRRGYGLGPAAAAHLDVEASADLEAGPERLQDVVALVQKIPDHEEGW
jgi:hypothetical protein